MSWHRHITCARSAQPYTLQHEFVIVSDAFSSLMIILNPTHVRRRFVLAYLRADAGSVSGSVSYIRCYWTSAVPGLSRLCARGGRSETKKKENKTWECLFNCWVFVPGAWNLNIQSNNQFPTNPLPVLQRLVPTLPSYLKHLFIYKLISFTVQPWIGLSRTSATWKSEQNPEQRSCYRYQSDTLWLMITSADWRLFRVRRGFCFCFCFVSCTSYQKGMWV